MIFSIAQKLLPVVLVASLLSGCGGSTGSGPSNNSAVLPPPSRGPVTPDHSQAVDTSGDDWPQFRRDSEHTGNNPYQTAITAANVSTLAPKWSYKTYGMFATPVVKNGVVYLADLGGALRAVRMSDGTKLWEFDNHTPANGNAFIDTPLLYKGVLYLGDQGLPGVYAAFRAINAASGHQIWQKTETWSQASFEASPVEANGMIFEGESSWEEDTSCAVAHQIVAYSPASPTIVSSLTFPESSAGGDAVWASPVADPSGHVFVGTGNSCASSGVDAYSDAIMQVGPRKPRLSAKWTYQAYSSLPNDNDFGSSPLITNGLIIEGNKNGWVYALNPTNGTLVWKTQLGQLSDGIVGTPASDGTHLYVPVNETVRNCAEGAVCGGIVSLNLSDGSIAWSRIDALHDDYDLTNVSAPAVSNGVVYDAYNSTIYAFDASNGNVLWSYTLDGHVYEGITIVNGGLLVGDFDGTGEFYCFTPGGV